MKRPLSLLTAAMLAAAATPALAHEPSPAEQKAAEEKKAAEDRKAAEEKAAEEKKPIEISVRADAPDGDAASRTTYGRRELELRPRLRPGDIVEAVPGLFAVQHAGGGKANQYFLRGFDADHGTDVALSVDGVPVNLPSHGHGQGFADLHFLIPELVVGLDGTKGPYYASQGDFATAGAVNMRLAEKFEESSAQYSIGQYGVMRGLVIASPDLGADWKVVAAAELAKQDGPFQKPEDLQRFNVFTKLTRQIGPSAKASVTWMSYGSKWNGSGQIPARAVCGEGEAGAPPPSVYKAPCIDRFGHVDPTEGGDSQRHALSLQYSAGWDDTTLSAVLYLVKYRFTLFSNFTFYAQDPVNGDEIEQGDDRLFGGAKVRIARHMHYRGIQLTTSGGVEARADSIDNSLYHDVARRRLEGRVHAQIGESHVGVFLEEDIRYGKYLRLVLGARADRLDVTVDDLLWNSASPGGGSSGVSGQMLFSPKAQAIVSPIPQLDLFFDYGKGFHSNDARGVVRAKDAPSLLTPATGYEVGVRVKPVKGLSVEAAAFLLDLASEIVYVGDEGTTEASGATRRMGIEVDARYRIGNWLFADAAATFVDAKYQANAGNGGAVALAPTRTFEAGIGARPTFGQFTPFGAVRVKSIADRPANETGTLVAQGFTVVDANAGVRWRDVEAGVDIQNLFDAKWREVSFATTTRLPYEPKPVTGVHYSPGWPFTAIARVSYFFR
ncbi:MAG: TonB-dependent receptor [Polyangiaceae bacterium]